MRTRGALNIKPQPGEKRASLIALVEQQVTYEMLHHRKAEKEKCNLSSSRTKHPLHLSGKPISKYAFQFRTHDCFSYARKLARPLLPPLLSLLMHQQISQLLMIHERLELETH